MNAPQAPALNAGPTLVLLRRLAVTTTSFTALVLFLGALLLVRKLQAQEHLSAALQACRCCDDLTGDRHAAR